MHQEYQAQKQQEIEKKEKLNLKKRKKLKGRQKLAEEAALEEQWGFYSHHGVGDNSAAKHIKQTLSMDVDEKS